MRPWREKTKWHAEGVTDVKEHSQEVSVTQDAVDAEQAPAADLEQAYAANSPWKTALLMGGSALLGATALALWNRRTLAKLQAESPANSTNSSRNQSERLDVKEFF